MNEMRDSGVSWIDKIPSNWKIVPLKSLFCFGKGLPITKADLVENGVAVINYGQIHAKSNTGTKVNNGLLRYVDEKYTATNPDSLVNKHDFLVADTSEDLAGCGNCVYVDTDIKLFAGYHTIILRSLEVKDHKYLAYLFKTDAWRSQIRSCLTDVKLFSITQKVLKGVSVLVPPDQDQQIIVEFLDQKCADIDDAISRHRTIIEKLEEYRKSVITEAVTKGLNPNVEMKDSGVKWVEVIPSHWGIKRIKYLFHIKKDIAGEEGHTVLSITQRGIIPKNLSTNEGQIAESYANYQLVEIGDFAMNHMDLLTGWVDISKYEGVTSPDYRVFVLNDTINQNCQYFLYVMQMCYFNRIFYGLGQGVSGLGRWRLQAPAFLNFRIPVPTLKEQNEISEYLADKCAKVNDAIIRQKTAIAKLEEYRKAVIYNAVLGKLDC